MRGRPLAHDDPRRVDAGLLVEELDARILYSADLNPVGDTGLSGPVADVRPLEAPPATDAAAATAGTQAPIRHEVVIVDAAVPDADALIAGLLAEAPDGRVFEVYRLGAGEDGIARISGILRDTGAPIDALHIVSHGLSGGALLGTSMLDGASLATRATEIEGWARAFSADADILLYGCDIAASDAGRQFTADLALLTGADVAASEDLTGASALGGDFDLEYSTGTIETAIALSKSVQQDFAGVLATFTVTNVNDSGAGSLRQAITDANNSAGADTIAFSIVGADPYTINLLSALPTINGQVTIDGRTENNFATNGNRPVIVIDGNNLAADGLTFSGNADGSVVRGLVIRDFQGNGIVLQGGADNITVAGNYIGSLSSTGTSAGAAEANTGVGVYSNGANATIGGSTTLDRNVISGNGTGVMIDGASTSGTRVMGNLIGVALDGSTVIANSGSGVLVQGGATGVVVGTDLNGSNDASEGNVISGNTNVGVQFWGAGSNNYIRGNIIGLNASATAVVGNGSVGVQLGGGTSGTTIGGTSAAAANTIGGNTYSAIELVGGSGHVVQGNYLGTNASGASGLGNAEAGIFVFAASSGNTIGGSAPGARNVISGNLDGVILDGAGTTGNVVQANYIGTAPDGVTALANTYDGIRIQNGATANTIGGSNAGMGNVIAGNGQDGIQVDGEASDNNVIRGNRIGVSATGTLLGNDGDGVYIYGGADGTIVGGSGANEGNWIAGSGLVQVEVDGASTGTRIQGNRIGTDLAGTANWGSQQNGILLEYGASSTLVGGTAAGEGNIIAFSGQGGSWTDGVEVWGATSLNNAILGNAIYSSAGLGIDLGNDHAVATNDATDSDTGPNSLQNYPVLWTATTTGSDTTVAGEIQSTGPATYRIEFFASAVADASGHGEAQRYLGFTTVTTDGSGYKTFAPTLLGIVLASGERVTATATRDLGGGNYGDTSEFAMNVIADGNDPPQNQVPGPQSLTEDGTLVFATGIGNAISISDPDPGTNPQQVTLAVSNGTLSLAGTAGLTFTTGDGAGDATMTFSGTLSAINAALDGLMFSPTPDYAGGAVLSIGTVDRGVATLAVDAALGGRYAFEAAGTPGEDSSPAGINDATIYGATAGVDGTLGNVLDFAAGDHATINGLFASPASVTLAAWVNLTVADSLGSEVISLGDNVGLRLDYSDGAPMGVSGFYFDGTTWNGVQSGQFIAGTGWHHVAYTFDDTGNVQTIYIDGAAVASASATASINYTVGSTTTIGIHAMGDTTYDFTGSMDDVRVYSRSLSASEIALLANGHLLRDDDTVAITINPLNDAPVITSNGGGSSTIINVAENIAAVTTVTSTDVDGGVPVYSIVGGADAARFSIDANTGALAFLVAPDFEAPADAGANNVYDVTVQVSDGAGGSDTQALAITVTDVAIASVSVSGNGLAQAGQAYTLTLAADEDASGWTVNWGDGTISTYAGDPGSVTHTYAASTTGLSFSITASASDAAGTHFNTDLLVPSYAGTDSVHRYDGDAGTFAGTFAPLGDGLNDHVAVVTGPNGNLFVSGFASNNVLEYRPDGSLVGTFAGAGSGGLSGAAGIAFGPDGNLYVASANTNAVLRYDGQTGAFIGSFVPAGTAGLSFPLGVVFGPDGDLYASSRGATGILRFDGVTGSHDASFSTAQVGAAEDIAFGPDGNLYVAAGPAGVLRFSAADGSSLGTFVAGGSGGLVLAAGLSFGPDGLLYVGDQDGDAIRRYDGATGAYIDDYVPVGGGGLNSPAYQRFAADLEVRVVPAALTVTTTSDVADGDTSSIAALLADMGADGEISLREAILAANNTSGLDTIAFRIAGSGPHTITPLAALPSISDAVVIDGTTEPDFAANGDRPIIVLDGNNLAASGLVLTSTADGSTIRGLVIRDFTGYGIEIQSGSDNNTIAGNYIGRLTHTGADAGAGEALGNDAISIAGAYTTIGGLGALDGNVIAGAAGNGIRVNSGYGTVIQGNIIGLDATGSVAVGNTNNGIWLNGVSGATVGGTTAAARNVISGNGIAGVLLFGGSGNTVAGNYIGTNAAGTTALGNGTNGINVLGTATGNTIGGTTAASRNIISGNGIGVLLSGSGVSGNVVSANYIGTDVTGMVDLGNATDGVEVSAGAHDNRIGGTGVAEGNQISGNGNDGIWITGLGTNANTVQGNRIGLDTAGGALGNSFHGIGIENGAANNLVGGTVPGAGNQIANNAWDGIAVANGTGSGNALLGNEIWGNAGLGIDLNNDDVTANDAGDVDTGANALMNFPVIYDVIISGGSVTITGEAAAGAVVEFYEALADASGYGEGRWLVGRGTVAGSTPGTIDPSARQFSFVFAVGALVDGDLVTATATDPSNNTSEFAANVAAVANVAPVITSDGGGAAAAVNVAENTTSVTTVTATDADVPGQTLTYAIAGGADSALFVIDADSGALSFAAAPDYEAPADADVNNVYEVTVQVSDGNGGTDTQSISVTVTPVNDLAPVISSDGGGATAAVNVAENTTSVTTVTATDADLPGQTLTYAITGGADAALFSIDANTGVLSFVAAPDYEAPTDANSDNVYDVTVQVSDGSLTDSQAISVTVTPVNDAAPVITSDGGGANAAVNVAENTTAVTTVTATDADLPGQTLTYAIAGGADAALFSIDANTGVLSFVAAPDYEAPTDANSDNVYDVTVQVSDGSLTDTQALGVTVTPVNDAAPVITSDGGGANAAVNVAENTTAVTTVTATDADLPGQTLTYAITGGADAARFTIDTNTGALSFVAAPDYEAPTDANSDNVYDVTVQASDGSLTDSQAISVTVTPVNDLAPVITSDGGGANAAVNVAENTTAVTTVTATDADLPGQTLTYAITGGADAALFTIDTNTGVLSFVAAPDYEAPTDANSDNVYDVTVQVFDGSLTDSQALSVTVTPVNDAAPVITSDGGGANAAVNVAENTTAVTTVTATDADLPGQTLTYAITGGADAARFTIDTNSGALSFVAAPDYEAPTDANFDNVYDVTIQVSDGSLTDSQAISVTVTNANEPPTITSDGGGAAATVSIAENTTSVTTVTSSDVDGGTPTYSVVGGADATLFSIDAGSGALSFVAAPDYEAPTDSDANNVYEVTVAVDDGNGGTDTQAISVTVTPVNDFAPVITSDGGGATAAVNVAENTTNVTTVSATDADLPGQTLTYAITGGADAALFSIDANSGVLSFVAAPDYEAPTDANFDNVYDVTVQASDGSLTDSQAISVTVTPVNDLAPVITSDGGGANAAVNVAENTTAVTTVTATDADLPGQTLTYAITGGADAALFTIDTNTGVLSFVAAPDYEAPTDANFDNVYDVTVQVSDGSLTDSQAISVTVTPVNDLAPVITSDGGGANAAVNVAENTTAVTTVTATDADLPGQTLTYAITGGADAALFTIDTNTGVLSFIAAPDYEAPTDANSDNVYDVTVQASDGSLTDSQAISVTVTPVNDLAPVITSDGGGANAAVNVAENTTAVTTVTATDADLPGQTLTYAIAGGADAALFSIDANTGALSFVAAPDYEAPADAGGDNVYDLLVQVSDGSLTDSQAISVTVTPVNDLAPVITSDGGGANAAVNVAENTTAVTTVTATDADLPGQTLTYAITGGADAALFTIDANTGVLSFIAAPNYEAPTDANSDNVYDVTVQASDGSLTDSQAISLTVTPVNDFAPVITSDGGGNAASLAVAENVATVTTVTAIDSDLPGDTIGFTIVGGADAARFTIDANTGVLSFVAAPDYEAPTDANSDNVYDVTVQASDGSLTDTQAISVTVTPVNDLAPVITSDGGGATALVGVNENTTAVTSVTATDADQPVQTISYAIVGGADAALFTIDAGTGALAFVSARDREAPTDANLDNIYEVTVEASDGGLVDTQAISVTVLGVNEAPVAVGNATLAAILEDALAPAGDTVANLFGPTFSDPDVGDTLGGVAVRAYPADPTQGAWQYSVDAGASWLTFGSLSDSAAVALGASDRLRFLPAADFAGVPTSLSVRLIDSNLGIVGGASIDVSVNGGQTPISAGTASVLTSVTGVNDAPDGTDRTVVAAEDTPLVLSSADFGFTDAHDSPGNTLSAVRIDSLPSGGTLRLNGSGVLAGQAVAVADIDAGLLAYTPAADAFGIAIDSLTFSVIDDGGTANGGADTDPSPNTLRIDVAPVNDAPSIVINALAVTEGEGVVLSPTLLQAADVDTPPSSITFTASAISAGYFVRLGTAGDLASSTGGPILGFTQADVNAGLVAFVHDGSESTPTYTLVASDGALSSAASTPTVSFTRVNEAPTVVAASFALPENAPGGQVIGTVSASDPDLGDAISYAIVGGTGADRVAIDAASGTLTVANGAVLDFESTPSFSLLVRVTDKAGLSREALMTVSLTDVNEAPTDLVLLRVNAISQPSSPYGNFVVSDPDTGETFSFTLLDDGFGRFRVDTATGSLAATAAAQNTLSPDSVYRIVVQATDSGGHVIARTIDFQVPPIFADSTGVSGGTSGVTTFTSASSTAGKQIASAAPIVDDREVVQPAPTVQRAGAATSPKDRVDTVLIPNTGNAAAALDSIEARTSIVGAGDQQVRRVERAPAAPAPAEKVLLANLSFDSVLTPPAATIDPLGDWVGERLAIRRGDIAFSLGGDALAPREADGDESDGLSAILSDPIRMAEAIVSASAIWWVARAGGILASMLLGAPAWRHIDLVPVLMKSDDDADEEQTARPPAPAPAPMNTELEEARVHDLLSPGSHLNTAGFDPTTRFATTIIASDGADATGSQASDSGLRR